ncbi:MAG: PAS domain S-box protein, partial [Bacteroidota bacterium]
DGTIRGHIAIAHDITNLKLKEKQARELGEFQNVILNSTNYAIFSKGESGTFSSFNRGAEELTGYSAEEVIGIHNPIILHDRDEFRQRAQELSKEYNVDLKPGLDTLMFEREKGLDKTSCYTLVRKDGQRLKVAMSLSELKNEEGHIKGHMCIARDITAEKLKEEKARDLSDFRDFIINSNNLAIFTEGPDNLFTYFSKGAEKMLGYKAEEMVGKHRPAILHDVEEFEPRAKYLSEKYGMDIKPGLDSLLFETRMGLDNVHDWTFIRKDGKRIKVNLSITLIKNNDGTDRGILAIARDVTQQKNDALRVKKYAETLENKNRELEQFTYIASHDLQEPLRTIANFTSLINRSGMVEKDPKLRQYFEFIAGGTERMQNLVKCLLDYSRLGRTAEFVPVDTQQIMKE